jgi:hypothetical protein
MTKKLFTGTSILHDILSINPQPEGKNPYPILIGIIIAVLLIESMGKPTGLKWTGGLQCIKLLFLQIVLKNVKL